MTPKELPRLPRKAARILAIGSAGVFVFLLGTFFYKAYYFLRPERRLIEKTPKDLDMDYEDVKFTTSDGLKLAGWFIPSKKTCLPAGRKKEPVIIFCHGHPANRTELLDLAPAFISNYNLLLFDFRGLGESEGLYTALGAKESRDLIGAINYLKTRDDVDIQKIGVLGFSMGGAVALMTAENCSEIRAVVADSAYANLVKTIEEVGFKGFGPAKKMMTSFSIFMAQKFFNIDIREVSPEESVKKLKIPIFLIHARDDQRISFENSKTIYEAAQCPKEFWLVPNGGHEAVWQEKKEEYQKRVLDFFQKHL